MISHYLKFALKVLAKYRYHTFINIFGLTAGMLGALIIAKYIGGSLQLDSFHENRKQVHFISQRETVAGSEQQERTTTYQGVADLVSQFPQALLTTKYIQHVEALVLATTASGELESFNETKIFMSDSSFFKVFTFQFLHGNPVTALSREDAVVITQTTASKYFKNENPVGKTISIRTSWGQELSYEVTGVIRDAPKLSRFQFDFLIGSPTANSEELWNLADYPIFVLLDQQADPSDLSQKLNAQLKNVPELKSAHKNVSVSLRSIADVPLSNTEVLLVSIGIMIAVIAWVNYINQSIAHAYWRTRQIGILKVFGASKANLRTQFAIESAITCSIALLLVIGTYAGLERSLQSLTNAHLLPLFDDPTLINLLFAGVFLVGTLLAAVAPTVILFRQDLEKTLRTNFAPQIGGVAIRKVFVVVQFSISTVLLVGIFVVNGQLDYMERKDKGITMDNVLVLKDPLAKGKWMEKVKALQSFKDQAMELPFVKTVTSSTTVPGDEYRHETYLSIPGNDNKTMVHQTGVDENFFSLYNVQFIAGQDFIQDAKAKNRESIILNEAAAKALGFSDPAKLIDVKIVDQESPDEPYNVVGVIKDFNQTSLKYEVRPLAFKYNAMRGHFSFRFDTGRLSESKFDEAIASLKTIWKETYPEAAFEYYFLDERFRAQDQQDQYFRSLFEAFTILSILLSCLGLFGLSILISTKRQKEVGVRKTFGATSLDILKLFLKGYLRPLAVAFSIGATCSYLVMREWLTTYANRIEIGPGLILSAALALISIFLLTISYHTVKAATTNPVKVLRD